MQWANGSGLSRKRTGFAVFSDLIIQFSAVSGTTPRRVSVWKRALGAGRTPHSRQRRTRTGSIATSMNSTGSPVLLNVLVNYNKRIAKLKQSRYRVLRLSRGGVRAALPGRSISVLQSRVHRVQRQLPAR